MKINFLSTIPLNKVNGGTIYTNSILNLTKSIFKEVEINFSTLEEYRYINSKYLRMLHAAINSTFTGNPLTILYHSSFLKTKKLNDFIEDCDILICDHIESTRNVLKKEKGNIIYISHNIEWKLLESRLKSIPKFIRNKFISELKNHEDEIFKNSAGVITISNSDAELISIKNKNTAVIYPCFFNRKNTDSAKQKSTNEIIKLGFIGSANWKANRDAVTYAIKNILPNIKKNYTYILCGSGWSSFLTSEDFNSSQKEHIKPIGFVKDTTEFWNEIDVLLAPMTDGEGTNVKVCESLYMNRPVVGTSKTFRGLDKNITKNSSFESESPLELSTYINELRFKKNIPESEYFSYHYNQKILSEFFNKTVLKTSIKS